MNPSVEVTQRLFERFGAADIPGILEYIHDDIVIEFYGPSVIPYAGTYQGREAARQFFNNVLSNVDIHVFEAEQFFSEGAMVSVTGTLHLTAKSTGRDIKSSFAHVITVQDGKWIRFRDFMDTSVAVAAFS
ncbi:MAG: nuclear transport factor 2 family protein [Pseudomonadales bacterium]